MRIHLQHIVLDGIDIPPSQRDRLKAAVSAELARLWSAHLASGQAIPAHRDGNAVTLKVSVDVPFSAQPQPASLGQQVGQQVFQAMHEQS